MNLDGDPSVIKLVGIEEDVLLELDLGLVVARFGEGLTEPYNLPGEGPLAELLDLRVQDVVGAPVGSPVGGGVGDPLPLLPLQGLPGGLLEQALLSVVALAVRLSGDAVDEGDVAL